MFFKTALTAFLLLFVPFGLNIFAQPPNPHYKLKGSNFVQSKNYYLLTLLQTNPAVKRLLETDAELLKLSETKLSAIKASLTCKDAACYTQSVKFTADEIQMVSNWLDQHYQPNNALAQLVKNDLIPSGTYILNKRLSPKEQLIKAWEQDAEGLNYTIGIYADGKKPNYPDIDSISFKVNAKSYPDVLHDCAYNIAEACKNNKLFFGPILGYALQALEINGRNDAANYEPLTAGINKSATLKIKQTDWTKYKYSVILVLGSGPNDLTTPLSAIGMLRCGMGAANYFAGLAPFIIVSGGMAHPYKTKYCEGEQMKKYLVNTLHVPESAVLAEPHARHTTTNIRNAERIMYRCGIPFDKPYLTTTSKSHSEYLGLAMAARCLLELKCVPYKVGNRISETTLEFYPTTDALQINPQEPLDPQ